MAITPPSTRLWWSEPVARTELIWIAIAFLWGLVMFFMMIYWHAAGGTDQITAYFLYTFPETRRATPPRHRTLGAGQTSDVRARLGAPDHASTGEGG